MTTETAGAEVAPAAREAEVAAAVRSQLDSEPGCPIGSLGRIPGGHQRQG